MFLSNNIHLHSIYFLTTLPHTFTIFFLLTLLHPGAIIQSLLLSLGGVTSSGRLQPSVQHIMHKQSSGCQILHRFRPQVPPSKTSLCPGKSGSWRAVDKFILHRLHLDFTFMLPNKNDTASMGCHDWWHQLVAKWTAKLHVHPSFWIISLMNQEISFEFESELSPNCWVQNLQKHYLRWIYCTIKRRTMVALLMAYPWL